MAMHKSTYLPREFTSDLVQAARLWRRLTPAVMAQPGNGETGSPPPPSTGRLKSELPAAPAADCVATAPAASKTSAPAASGGLLAALLFALIGGLILNLMPCVLPVLSFKALGLAQVFVDAGAEWRESGCSMCLGMNGDTVAPGMYCVSTSNRNFEGRQGSGARTLLASPATAAAAAVRGCVTDPREFIH